MLGGVVHNPDPRIGQYLLQGIAHSHHIFVVIGIPPGVPRVVGFAVIRLIAFGSMGVEDQDLRRVGPLEGEVHPLLHDLYDRLLCLDHSRRCDHPHMPHGILRRLPVDSMDLSDTYAVQRQIHRPERRIHCHDPFHRAAVVSSVADHTGQAARHILDHPACRRLVCAPHICQTACHPRSCRDPAPAECRQSSRILLDIHCNQET